MNIGIITFHNANNYGAVLQCYALSKVLIDFGNKVELINLPLNEKPKTLRSFFRSKMTTSAFSSFRINNLPNSRDPSSQKDVYIFGSDQVWNPQITKSNYELYFGSWVKNNIPKLAYAASFGISKWDYPEYTSTVQKQLNTFKGIGIRESSGVQICKDIFKVDCNKVLDPTMLLNNYDNLFKPRKVPNSLVCYIFGKDEFKIKEIGKIAKKSNLKSVLLNDMRIRKNIKSIPFPSVSKWLSYLNAGELILTDSFHCMVFAIIFKKNFIAIPAIPERVDRMLSLLVDLGLESRFFYNINDVKKSKVLFENINYEKVYKVLKELRNDSIDFLQKSLSSIQK